MQRESTRETHGETRHRTRTPEYRAWIAMRERCESPNHKAYPYYGGRGIAVCARWRGSFSAFLADVGRRPSPAYSIDRIDTNGNYEPGNVAWSTRTQQSINRRNARFLTFNGETCRLAEWADRIGVNRRALAARLRIGWSVEKALTTPALPAFGGLRPARHG